MHLLHSNSVFQKSSVCHPGIVVDAHSHVYYQINAYNSHYLDRCLRSHVAPPLEEAVLSNHAHLASLIVYFCLHYRLLQKCAHRCN